MPKGSKRIKRLEKDPIERSNSEPEGKRYRHSQQQFQLINEAKNAISNNNDQARRRTGSYISNPNLSLSEGNASSSAADIGLVQPNDGTQLFTYVCLPYPAQSIPLISTSTSRGISISTTNSLPVPLLSSKQMPRPISFYAPVASFASLPALESMSSIYPPAVQAYAACAVPPPNASVLTQQALYGIGHRFPIYLGASMPSILPPSIQYAPSLMQRHPQMPPNSVLSMLHIPPLDPIPSQTNSNDRGQQTPRYQNRHALSTTPPSISTKTIHKRKKMSSKSEDALPNEKETSKVAFPEKLFQIINDFEKNGKREIISWVYNGCAFEIYKPEEFITEVSPKHFRHKHIDSFRRQLQNYAFQNIQRPGERASFRYAHELFLKDKPENIKKIRRIERSYDPDLKPRWKPKFDDLPAE